MKKLDYTSLFLSMVSLVWMLTMLQELPALAQAATAHSANSLLAERVSLTQLIELRAAAQGKPEKLAQGRDRSLLTL
ncbi:hypothetical protein [Pseudanabaena sp. FACHB-2040]|uniref:hypothetical protein n=1 Tax=Pseudanabaena sp. FACHB-2040 TaxID=2692859 RepID=UPI0019BF69A5|nr:hypothetical protein [Pseudanabaena sp. FACHB-2040]MBD2260216.1 hypothetical protein [Pseudanabaena sp. FACHB-2040]